MSVGRSAGSPCGPISVLGVIMADELQDNGTLGCPKVFPNQSGAPCLIYRQVDLATIINTLIYTNVNICIGHFQRAALPFINVKNFGVIVIVYLVVSKEHRL